MKRQRCNDIAALHGDIRPIIHGSGGGTGECVVTSSHASIDTTAILVTLESGIHIFDYLVAYPLRGIVERMYSADDHFQHEHFKYAEVVNPVAPWILREGVKPTRRTLSENEDQG